MPADGREHGKAIKYLDYWPMVGWLLQQRVHHCQAVEGVKSHNLTWLGFEGHSSVASLLSRLG